MKTLRIGVIAALLALGVAGCTATHQIEKPTTKTPAQALADFKKIAKASCDKAMSVGVVETSTSGDPFTIVLVPKAKAYKDFSAAALEANKYTLIYENDSFASCGAANTFSVSGAAIKVAFDPADGSYTTTENCYGDGPCVFKYTVAKGLMTSFTNLSAKTKYTQTIRYGNLTAADWEILHKAVDQQGN